MDEEYRRVLLARAKCFVADIVEAEDLVQEAFLKAHRAEGKLRDERARLAWLLKIVDNLCLDHLRKRDPLKESSELPENLETASKAPTVFKLVEQTEMSVCTLGYVNQLKASHREVLTMHDAEGKSAREIALALGISTGAVKIRLHRARANLKKLLREACTFGRDERGVFVCEPKSGAVR